MTCLRPEPARAPSRPRAAGERAAVWWVFAAWLGLLGAVHAGIWAGQAWHWFPQGAHLLYSSSWPQLYSAHPELQIGPLTFVLVAPFVFGLPARVGEVAAVVTMCAAGLLVLAQLRSMVSAPDRRRGATFFVAGLCFLVAWSELAVTFAHVDDVLAIVLTVFALRRLRCGQPYLAAVLLALAADCKPWAAAFVPLLLLAERDRRGRAIATWAAIIAVAWLPFVLADPRTLSAATYRIPNNLASSLRVLGVHAGSTPAWDRPAQMVLGAALALVLVRRRRWSAVVVVVIAARLLLDPSVWSYYDAGLLAGAVLCDLVLLAAPVPVLSLATLVVFYLPMFVLHGEPQLYGAIRTAFLLVVIGALAGLPDRLLIRTGAPVPVPAGPSRRA